MSTYPQRRSLRLQGYDYRQAGAYFFTVCTDGRACLFGRVEDGVMNLSAAGRMLHDVWDGLPERLQQLERDAFVVMPNHVHGIVLLQPEGPGSKQLGDVLRVFKSLTSHEYSLGVGQRGWPQHAGRLWQRNYYEHVVRSESELEGVRTYIVFNAAQWRDDPENPGEMPGG